MAKKKYWYVFHHYECPPCGSHKVYKERVYEEPKERHIWHVAYDWCVG